MIIEVHYQRNEKIGFRQEIDNDDEVVERFYGQLGSTKIMRIVLKWCVKFKFGQYFSYYHYLTYKNYRLHPKKIHSFFTLYSYLNVYILIYFLHVCPKFIGTMHDHSRNEFMGVALFFRAYLNFYDEKFSQYLDTDIYTFTPSKRKSNFLNEWKKRTHFRKFLFLYY